MRTNRPRAGKKEPPRLRWYQWRLRTLFILTVVVAIAMSYVAVAMRDQRREYATAEAIRKAGGVPGCQATWLGRLLRDDSLIRIGSVGLSGKSVDAATLVHLQELSQLQTVLLRGATVTDDKLVHLEGLKQLKRLWLSETEITDVGLVHVQGLNQLEFLILNDTNVTDAGLTQLNGLTLLRLLDVRSTKVSREGAERLHHSLPHCLILGDFDAVLPGVRKGDAP
jgi:hypothetical protein